MDEYIMDLAALPREARESVVSYGQGGSCEAMDSLIRILSAVPQTIAIYKKYGIGKDILADTLSDIGTWAGNHRRASGNWGLDKTAAEWLENHVSGKLFKVGRLQFCAEAFKHNARVYRSVASGETLALVDEETLFRGDGQLSGTNGVHAGVDGFTGSSRVVSRNGTGFAEGTPISPLGHAENRAVSLDLREWTQVLCKGVPVLNMHITQEESFTPQACRDSLLQMREFARKYDAALRSLAGIGEADAPFAAFTISSWLLDPQLESLLPANSNLASFLRQFYLMPLLSSDGQTLRRVFGQEGLDLENLPTHMQKTSLQRSIAGFMRTGGRLRASAGFILMDDAESYGTDVYRRGSSE